MARVTSARRAPRWLAWVFMALGLLVAWSAWMALPEVPLRRRTLVLDEGLRRWLGSSLGLAFFCAGLAVRSARAPLVRWWHVANGAVLLAALLGPLMWFVYLSGQLGWGMRALFSLPLALGAVGAVFGLVQTARRVGMPPRE